MIGAAVMVAKIATGEVEDIVALVEASEPKCGKGGPYKKRNAA